MFVHSLFNLLLLLAPGRLPVQCHQLIIGRRRDHTYGYIYTYSSKYYICTKFICMRAGTSMLKISIAVRAQIEFLGLCAGARARGPASSPGQRTLIKKLDRYRYIGQACLPKYYSR